MITIRWPEWQVFWKGDGGGEGWKGDEAKMRVYMKGARVRVKEGNQIPKAQFLEQKSAV